MEQDPSPEAIDLLDALGIADVPAESYPLLGGDGPHRGIIRHTKWLGTALSSPVEPGPHANSSM